MTKSTAGDRSESGCSTCIAPEAKSATGSPFAHRIKLPWLCGLALIVGVITGLGAVVFRALIGLVHNLFFLGQLSFTYDASQFTPAAPWGAYVIFVPLIGGLGVTWIVNTFAPEAKGHGVPEVMDAIYYKGGLIRPVVAVVKSIASALAIGSGAAVGREGPIIQIGSALGSTLGSILRMPSAQRIILVAAGAGAGIAATFNTPIGGVLFATEIMMPEISVDTFLPVAIATGTATFIGRIFFSSAPAFFVPMQLGAIPNTLGSIVTLILYALLGILAGAAAALLIRSLYWTENAFERIRANYLRHACGMLLIGVLMYLLWRNAGHYFIEGVGYSTIQAILYGQLRPGVFLLMLALCKVLATSISLGSGSSGGVFSPSLFIGATLGAAFSMLVTWICPGAPVSVPAFAMVGMGAVVGGGTGAAMTSVAMVFEMTRDYNVVLPMIIAVAFSLGTRRLLSSESIYTMKLIRRGHLLPHALHANMFMEQQADQIMDRDVVVLDADTPFSAVIAHTGNARFKHVVVTKNQNIFGVLRINLALHQAVSQETAQTKLGVIAQFNFIVIHAQDPASTVITMLDRENAAMAVVIEAALEHTPPRVLGIIAKEHIADSVASSIKVFTS